MVPGPVSIVIAAHEEAGVIGETLRRLVSDAVPGELDVTVAVNGSSDATAQMAREVPGVRVLDLPEPGKVGALDAADAVAVGYPRLYLDADIPLTTHDVRRLAGVLRAGAADGVLAVTGRRLVDSADRPWPVRSYSEVHERLGWFDGHLFGRGAVMLSEQGRARFDRFPPVLADDLFLDTLFAPHEKRAVDEVVCLVQAPRSTGALLRRLVRVRAGNAALRQGDPAAPRARGGGEALGACARLVARRPSSAPATAAYLAITGYAALRSRAVGAAVPWGQDRSTRGRPAQEDVP